jgi:hypothetical protein
MLDLPMPMRVHNSWVESSRLFKYANAFCDIPCTETEFRNWQLTIAGASVTNAVPFPIQNMPPTVREWWINVTPPRHAMFQAKKGGVTVVAVWYQGKAFVDFGMRGDSGETWDRATMH